MIVPHAILDADLAVYLAGCVQFRNRRSDSLEAAIEGA